MRPPKPIYWVYFIGFMMVFAFILTHLTPKSFDLVGKWVYFPEEMYFNIAFVLWPLMVFKMTANYNWVVKGVVLGYAGSKLIDLVLVIKNYVTFVEGQVVTYEYLAVFEIAYLSQWIGLSACIFYIYSQSRKQKQIILN